MSALVSTTSGSIGEMLERARTLPTLFSLLLATAGCQRSAEVVNREERAANAKKVTADSTDDATEPIVDEGYRFRLTLPGPRWKLLREHDASRLNPDAIAGAVNSSDAGYGIVLVERLPGTTLEQAQAMVWSAVLTDSVIESEIDLEFQGIAAKRRAFTASVGGQPFRYLATIFIHQDHLYQLLSWSSDVASANSSTELLRFHDAFELLDGEIRGRDSIHAPIVDADGVGWRIRDGRYEGALSELRVRPSAGWRFVIGSELELLGTDAEIVFLHEMHSAYLALVAERISKDRHDSFAQTTRQVFESARTAAAIETFERDIAGRRVEFRRYDEPPMSFVHGVYVGDEAITQLTIWYPLGLAGEARPALDEMFAGIEALPVGERGPLRQALLSSAGSQRQFSKDLAFRAGEFLDYEHRLRWTKPSGFWHVDPFSMAVHHSAETVLTATELDLGVHVAIEALPSDANPGDVLSVMVADYELLSSEVEVIDGLSIHRAKATGQSYGSPMSYAIAATRREDLLLVISAWSMDDSPTHRMMLDAAVAGLAYDLDPQRSKTVDGVYHDVEHGFSFYIPAPFDQPKVSDFGLAQVAAWTEGKQELVSLFVAGAPITDDEAWITSYFEQILRDRMSAEDMPMGKPTRSKGKLGGHTTRHLSWEQDRRSVSADILVRDAVIYCLVYVNLSAQQIEVVQSSWSLLE
jgi:hypothetical protein